MLAALLAMLLAPASAPEAIVGGWVVHAHSGARLPGATVSLHCRMGSSQTQWTDLDGAFVLRGLPAGSCVLFAALGTHTPRVKLLLHAGERRLIDIPLDPESKKGDYWTMKAIMVRNEPYITRVPFKLPAEAEVVFGGVVLDSRTREALPGAVLVLRRGDDRREAHAGPDGTFAFRGVTPGECTRQVLVGAVTQTTALLFASGERHVLDIMVDSTKKPKIDPAFRQQARRQGDTTRVPIR